MKQVSIYLSDPQVAALKALSEETGLAYAELIRRAVDQYLKAQKKEK